MFKLIINVILTALTIKCLLPVVHGVHFDGGFGTAIGYAVLFGIVGIVVDLLIMGAASVLVIGTGGLGALIVVPLFILGWWLVPALQLEALATWFPAHFAVDSFGAAMLAGLLLMVVNIVVAFVERMLAGPSR